MFGLVNFLDDHRLEVKLESPIHLQYWVAAISLVLPKADFRELAQLQPQRDAARTSVQRRLLPGADVQLVGWE